MGADFVFAYYGIKCEITDEQELDSIETENHDSVIRAKGAGLSYCCDRTTEGAPHFLLIGTKLGAISIEASENVELNKDQLQKIHEETKEKLVKAGFDQEPKLHIELAAQY